MKQKDNKNVGILLSTEGSSSLVNLLTSKDRIRVGEGTIRENEEIIRADQEF